MAMTQAEINALISKINAGTYTLDDALEDIAAAAKGRDVRAAIYSLAYVCGKVSAADLAKKVSLPVTADGSVDHGTVGQFAVSDGNGGVTWVTIADGNEVAY